MVYLVSKFNVMFCLKIEVYKAVMHNVINEVLAGFNCTVFAYGQTGSGKTYTMEGRRSPEKSLSWDTVCMIFFHFYIPLLFLAVILSF